MEDKAVFEPVLKVFEDKKRVFKSVRLQSVRQRKNRLTKLSQWIKANRQVIREAIHLDFRKPAAEVDTTEILPALDELNHAVTELNRWTKPKKVDAPITLLGTRSKIVYEPKGVCLIISPWNYPFNLSVGPLISALAAGNVAIIKPSEYTPHTSALIKKLVAEVFTENEVSVIEGDSEVSQALLTLPFDHIFFTGSPAVGKLVMKAAAENLTSVTLELGGKSPTIITPSADIKEAATRVAVTKFINNGQTCIAPDYVLVHEQVATEFVQQLKKRIPDLFGGGTGNIQASPDYARIVSNKHAARLTALIQDAESKGAKVELTGEHNLTDRFIYPVILTGVPQQAKLMEEEIFGPVLPVLTYSSFDEVITCINSNPKPLALYIFGTNQTEISRITTETSSGSVCINDCAIQFLHISLPFGGVNTSGIGKAHGHYGFLAFSNEKPVVRQRRGLTTFTFFYPPYTKGVQRMINWVLKLF